MQLLASAAPEEGFEFLESSSSSSSSGQVGDAAGGEGEGAAAGGEGGPPLKRKGKGERGLLKKKRRQVEQGKGQAQDYYDIYGEGARASVEVKNASRSLSIRELQALVRWILTGKTVNPDWVFVKNKPLVEQVVVVLANGVDERCYSSHKRSLHHLPKLAGADKDPLQVRAEHSAVHPGRTTSAMFTVRDQNGKRRQNNWNGAQGKEVVGLVRPLPGKPPLPAKCYQLSIEDMQMNDFPLPRVEGGQWLLPGEGYVETAHIQRVAAVEEDGEIVEGGEYGLLAVDCEMCSTEDGLELTRVTLVDDHLNVIYDQLVKPDKPILDYHTQYSGITAEMLAGVTTRLADVQKDLVGLVDQRAILIGHSLENDLKSLKLIHPNVIDTALLYPHRRGPPYKMSLRALAKQWLGKEIQVGNHECSEDAKTAMDLALLKIFNGPSFGARDYAGENLIKVLEKDGVGVSLVDRQGTVTKVRHGAAKVATCDSDKEALAKTLTELASSNSKFIWTQFNDLNTYFEKRVKQSFSSLENESIQASWHEEGEVRALAEALDSRIGALHAALPPNTFFMVFTGQGNTALVRKLQTTKHKLTKAPVPEGEQCKWTEDWDRILVGEQLAAQKGLCFLDVKQ